MMYSESSSVLITTLSLEYLWDDLPSRSKIDATQRTQILV